MGQNDWAIVVGIQSYPEWDPLEGPDYDAQDFYGWLVDPQGGAVPEERVRLIVTPKDKLPFTRLRDAIPALQQIKDAIEWIDEAAKAAPLRNGDRYLGGRFYMYYAGHGFEPREGMAALVMANAPRGDLGTDYFWLSRQIADWFYQAGYFDEVVLLMDCCRTIAGQPVLSLPRGEVRARDFEERVRRFYAFATNWSKEARGERNLENGQVRGIFTQTLLEGLRKYGNEPGSDTVTTSSLAAYIRKKIPGLKPSSFVDDNFEMGKLAEPPSGVTVRVEVPEAARGKTIEIYNTYDGVVKVVRSIAAAGDRWETSLPKGLFRARVPELGLKTPPFEIESSEGIDVSFR